ncbi:MAG: YkgB family protein [Cyanobacteria bacterium]|nr:YkgB family protein [Cyanobacteriota bacterium]
MKLLAQALETVFTGRFGQSFATFSHLLMYLSLAIIFFWIGCMKFTAYEAEGIKGLVTNSYLISWMYRFLDVQSFSNFLGVVEITIGALIVGRLISPVLSFVGGGLSAGLFFTTLFMIVTVPGVFEPSAGGFPALSVVPGQFLLKDIGLMAIALFIMLDSAQTITRGSASYPFGQE